MNDTTQHAAADALFDLSADNAGPVRAKDATVRKLFRPECHRPGCDWAGGEHSTFADANAERQSHLNQHIQAARETGERQPGQLEMEAGQ